MPRLPLDATADAGSLITIDRFAGEYSLDGGAEVMAGHRLVVTRSAVIELSVVGQTAISIKQIEFWSTGGAIGFCDLLCFVVTEGECEPQTYSHFFQFWRGIIGIALGIIAADRVDPQILVLIVLSESGQLVLDMHHIGAVSTDEHDKQPRLPDERIKRIALSRHDVR